MKRSLLYILKNNYCLPSNYRAPVSARTCTRTRSRSLSLPFSFILFFLLLRASETKRKRDREGAQRGTGYLATGASSKYASRASTLFTRQLYFLFANKCVPLKIIFNIRVMWDPRDESASKVYFDSVVQRAMFLFPSSNTDARVLRARVLPARTTLCPRVYGERRK